MFSKAQRICMMITKNTRATQNWNIEFNMSKTPIIASAHNTLHYDVSRMPLEVTVVLPLAWDKS